MNALQIDKLERRARHVMVGCAVAMVLWLAFIAGVLL